MPCAVLERGLSPEEIEEAVEQLQQNWELAAVFDFFQVSMTDQHAIVWPAAPVAQEFITVGRQHELHVIAPESDGRLRFDRALVPLLVSPLSPLIHHPAIAAKAQGHMWVASHTDDCVLEPLDAGVPVQSEPAVQVLGAGAGDGACGRPRRRGPARRPPHGGQPEFVTLKLPTSARPTHLVPSNVSSGVMWT